MSWDRVIQDSDEEDEPLIEDDLLASTDPIQASNSPMQHDHEHVAAVQQVDYPEPTIATEPQLSVNFDQFLQSQDVAHGSSTLSQQHREERWIPSTGEGGDGSTGAPWKMFKIQQSKTDPSDPGAMILEIGAAQQRLFDDNTSSADQRLPSTATPYLSEISQPGSFPTVESFQYQQGATTEGFGCGQMRQDAPYEATQLIAPLQGQPYDYDTPLTSNHIDSPSDGLATRVNPISAPVQLDGGTPANQLLGTSQQSKFLQHATDSPHDTEPISSVVPPGLNGSQKETEEPVLISPQHSQNSAHDELSMPAVSVEISAVKKKRGRPKKQPMPENDEDDELSLPRDDGFDKVKPAEKPGPGRPPKSAKVVDTEDDTETSDTEGTRNTDPTVAIPEKDPTRTEDPVVSNPKEQKRKKVKRSKADSEGLQKSHKSAVDDDDVIWVDSRPLQVTDVNAVTEPSAKTNSTKPDTEPTALTDESNPNQIDQVHVPKKRGRKRKNAVEEPSAQTPPTIDRPPSPRSEASVFHPTTESTLEKNGNPETGQPTNEPQPPQSEESMKSNLPPETPFKQDISTPNKTAQRHSPMSSTGKVPYRVGLSRRARIAPLLKVVRK